VIYVSPRTLAISLNLAMGVIFSCWGAEYPPEKRNGEWEFQAFNADKSVNRNENLDRCFSCQLNERQDFVFTFEQMKSAK
jgi:hypothetical protein